MMITTKIVVKVKTGVAIEGMQKKKLNDQM